VSEVNGKKVPDGRRGDAMRREGNANALKTGIFSKNPLIVMKCDRCPVADVCPEHKEGASCYYEINGKPDLETAEGILEVLREKVEIDHVRYQRAIRAQSAFGTTQLDRDTNALSTALTRDLQVLAQMSTIFGVIKPSGEDPSRPVVNHSHTHIKAENVNLLAITKEELRDVAALELQLAQVQERLALASEKVIDVTPGSKK
jgi:hypothetical protein